MGRIVIATLLAMGLVACGRGDPLAIFGNSRDTGTRAVTPQGRIVDTRPLIARIDTLTVMQTPTGAVIRATGLAPVQGHWNGALIAEPAPAPGVLSYSFRALPPDRATRVSTPRSREVTVAVQVPNRDLQGIREIRVAAAGNARSVSRSVSR